jgi:hypothetical protein
LIDIVRFEPNHKYCGVERVSAYSSQEYITLASSSSLTKLVQNPTLKKSDEDLVNPVIETSFGLSQEAPPPIFLKLASTGNINDKEAQPFALRFKICNDQPIAFKQDTKINIVHDRGTQLTQEIDL